MAKITRPGFTNVFEWGNFKPLGAWLAEMEALLASQPTLDPPVEAQVACGMFLALMYAQPEHPEMRLWEQRVRQIILYGGHHGLQVKVGNHLLIYYTWWTGDLDKAELLIDSLRADPAAGHAAFAADHVGCHGRGVLLDVRGQRRLPGLH